MIDTVIFDIGNVLVDFDWYAYVADLFHDREIENRVTNAIFRTGYWDDLDPKACIFIDDKQTNVDVAIGLGMKGMVYKA